MKNPQLIFALIPTPGKPEVSNGHYELLPTRGSEN